MQEHFALRDRSIFDGIKRDAFCASSGVDRSTLYKVLGGGTVKRHNAELIAAGLGKPFEKVFEDKTTKRGLTGASTNKIKLNLSAIFTAAVKKEIMRRNPCKLATPPKGGHKARRLSE